MASSIYVYKNIEEYLTYYKGKENQLVYQIPIIDMFIDPKKEKLFVVTNQDNPDQKGNIDFFRTIVHVRNESQVPKMWESEYDIKVVQFEKINYNDKTGYLEFFPKFLRKPEMRQHVDRCVGGGDKLKYPVDYKYKFYDFTYDRINLVLDVPKKSILSRFFSLLQLK